MRFFIAIGLVFACQLSVIAKPIFTPPKGGSPKQTKGAGSRKQAFVYGAIVDCNTPDRVG
jgi:hypothetical protein